MKNYTVQTACEIAGRWREAGEVLALSDDQARELAPPFGGVLAPETVSKGATDGKLDRRQRKHRHGAQ